MTKILPATCENKVVTSMGIVVEGTIFGAGVAKSTGILILDDEMVNAVYIASISPDIEQTITKLITITTDVADAVSKIATTLTAIGTGMTGSTTAPPPTLPTNVTAINAVVTKLNATKTELETLKGKLT